MITLHQLYYFREVARRENMSKTAEELFVSQTTLSIMISKLETDLGFQLFSRAGKTLKLNEAGQMYLPYVEEVFMALENGRIALNRAFGEKDCTVTFCMSNSVVWTDAICKFTNRFPNYMIRQRNYYTDQFLDILNSARVDYAIAGLGDYNLDNLDYVVLGDDPLYLCVSKQHSFASRKSIPIEELSGVPLISLPQTAPFRVFCDIFFQSNKLDCNTVVECDYTLRKELISANYGAALTTQTAFHSKLLGEDNVYIRISGESAKRTLILVWNPKQHFRSQAALDFKEFLLQYFIETYPNQLDD
jgi:LysR family transcriptional activator of glutamate synthase operon